MKAICALSLNRVIGRNNELPWPKIPEDMAWLREVTLRNTIVMGRKTFESLGSRPLPQRLNVVLSRTMKQEDLPEGVPLIRSLDELKNIPLQGDIIIFGGAQIYEMALPWCDTLYLTWIKRQVAGDVFFPPFEHLFKEIKVLKESASLKIVEYRRL